MRFVPFSLHSFSHSDSLGSLAADVIFGRRPTSGRSRKTERKHKHSNSFRRPLARPLPVRVCMFIALHCVVDVARRPTIPMGASHINLLAIIMQLDRYAMYWCLRGEKISDLLLRNSTSSNALLNGKPNLPAPLCAE